MTHDKIWEREDHTLGKHQVLKSYLNGWFPILGRYNKRILFIDGFAGPGEYTGGEPGSPLIAIEAIRQHKERKTLREGDEVVALFIEEREDRAAHLKELLEKQEKIPGVSWRVHRWEFDAHLGEGLDYIEAQNKILAPAFVMIDPFGVKGSPMALIERILRNPKSEVFISFMYEPIRRFHQESAFEPHLTALFGSDGWKKCLDMPENSEQKCFLHDLFKEQLKNNGAKYVVNFELWSGNIHKYSIYFATGHEKGCDLMKEAIWKVVPDGNYKFMGYPEGQMKLSLSRNVDTQPLMRQLEEEFGQDPASIEAIKKFVMSDKTIYHKGQLRQKTLSPMEKDGRITVQRPSGGTGFANGKGITVRFNQATRGNPSQV